MMLEGLRDGAFRPASLRRDQVMNCSPIVGVVIPCFRVARFAGETVASVRGQTYPHWRTVVVDDGSPDDVWAAVREHVEADTRVRYVRTENRGVCAARNRGFDEIGREAEFVMFLDGDDRLSPLSLERLLGELVRHPEAALAHCEPRIVDETGLPYQEQRWMPRWARVGRFWARELPPEAHDETPFESIYAMAGVIPSLTLYRRVALAERFDEGIGQTGEDTDFTIAAALRGTARHLGAALVDYRRHPRQCSRDEARLDRQMPRVYAKWAGRGDLPDGWRDKIAQADVFRRGALRVRVSLIEGKRALRRGRPGEAVRALVALFGALRVCLTEGRATR